jgi:hypothetical protein
MRSSEAGFSLIGVMMVLGATLLGVMALLRSELNLRAASRSMDSVNSYEVFVSSFTSFVQSSVINNIDAICSGQTAPLTTLTFSGKPAGLSLNVNGPGADGSLVHNRCTRPTFYADGRAYFCLQIEPNAAYAKDSFAGAPNNFAEIAIRPVDKWQQPITCSQFRAAANAEVGLQIYYRLFWTTASQPTRLFQKYGYFYGIKE